MDKIRYGIRQVLLWSIGALVRAHTRLDSWHTPWIEHLSADPSTFVETIHKYYPDLWTTLQQPHMPQEGGADVVLAFLASKQGEYVPMVRLIAVARNTAHRSILSIPPATNGDVANTAVALTLEALAVDALCLGIYLGQVGLARIPGAESGDGDQAKA